MIWATSEAPAIVPATYVTIPEWRIPHRMRWKKTYAQRCMSLPFLRVPNSCICITLTQKMKSSYLST